LEDLLQAHVMENPDYEFTCMVYRELRGNIHVHILMV
jgi:hypothetical protein